MSTPTIGEATRKLAGPRFNKTFSQQGPTPIFKKRYDALINAQVANNITNGLIANITIRETGTIYALKLSMKATQVAGAVGDMQECDLMFY